MTNLTNFEKVNLIQALLVINEGGENQDILLDNGNVEMIKDVLGDSIKTLHFDEAWLPHAAFHDFYKNMHAIGTNRPKAKNSIVFSFPTQQIYYSYHF